MNQARSGNPSHRPISGLGPHGEHPASADDLRLSDAAVARISGTGHTVALVLHVTHSDWARLLVAGVRATLERHGAQLVDIVDYAFRADLQAAALGRILDDPPNAVISIPIHNATVSEAHREITRAGIPLILMDNAPTDMVVGKDYASLVSGDNFGNGEVAAEILAEDVDPGGQVCVVGYGINFPVTNERELGFRRWLRRHRPDLRISRVEFDEPSDAGEVVKAFLARGERPDGLFVVWAEPATLAVQAVLDAGLQIPTTTVDLSDQVAREIARGGLIRGAGAQLPYDQGVAEAMVTLMALAGEQPPPWVAIPALAVRPENLLDAYAAVTYSAAPSDLQAALRKRGVPWDRRPPCEWVG